MQRSGSDSIGDYTLYPGVCKSNLRIALLRIALLRIAIVTGVAVDRSDRRRTISLVRNPAPASLAVPRVATG